MDSGSIIHVRRLRYIAANLRGFTDLHILVLELTVTLGVVFLLIHPMIGC